MKGIKDFKIFNTFHLQTLFRPLEFHLVHKELVIKITNCQQNAA